MLYKQNTLKLMLFNRFRWGKYAKLLQVLASGILIAASLMTVWTFISAIANGGSVTIYINRYSEQFIETVVMLPLTVIAIIINLWSIKNELKTN